MPEKKTFFRGGAVDINDDNITNAFVDAADTNLYQSVKTTFNPASQKDLRFDTNEDFWKHVIDNKAYIDQNIILSNFFLTEWLPASPGLFYTESAIKNRAEAEKYLVRSQSSLETDRHIFSKNSEYFIHTTASIHNDQYFNTDQEAAKPGMILELNPYGKESMVLGGIGTVRLLPKKLINGERFFIYGASSNGVCHEGIPVLLNSSLYDSFVSELKDNCGLRCTLLGKLCILPTDDLPIRYDRKISKYCLWVENIIERSKCWEEQLTVSVAITYSASLREIERKQWSFVTFHPDKTDRHLVYSVEWLQDYAVRHSGNKTPIVFCDFDEYKQHFDKTEFPLRDLANGKIDFAKLAEYQDIFNFKIVNVMGDNFENISGTVINRSIVENSFNKLSGQIDKESLEFIKQLTADVEKSGNRDAVDNMEEFHKEIQKPEPKKSLLKTFWAGVVTAVPALITNADKVMSIIEKVGKIMPN